MRTSKPGGWLEICLIYLSFLVLAVFTTMSLQHNSEFHRKAGREESSPVIEGKQQVEESVLDAQAQIEEIINLLAGQNGWVPRETPDQFIASRGPDHDRSGVRERSFLFLLRLPWRNCGTMSIRSRPPGPASAWGGHQ